jgi:F-type H+-transporting ATPase subunit b
MLIDWFTVGAQALNFVVLVWLMKRFLYQPVLDAIDLREKRIAAALADADAKQRQAGAQRDEFQRLTDELEQQRAALLGQATQDAEAERQRLVGAAKSAADALSTQRQQALRSDARQLNQALARRTQQQVMSIARKTLADLADAALDERIAEVFLRRLRALDGAARHSIAHAIETAPGAAVVRSAFELPAPQRAAILVAVNQTLSTDIRLRFETDPDLVAGIELRANGQKLAWSIGDYLDTLQQRVDEGVAPRRAGEVAEATEATDKTETAGR